MKLLTKQIEDALKRKPLYSTDGKSVKKVIVKFFGGSCFSWYVVEAEQQEDGDWLFFGLADMGYGAEFGYFTLSELKSIKFPPFGLGIERDKYFNGKIVDGKVVA